MPKVAGWHLHFSRWGENCLYSALDLRLRLFGFASSGPLAATLIAFVKVEIQVTQSCSKSWSCGLASTRGDRERTTLANSSHVPGDSEHPLNPLGEIHRPARIALAA